MGFGSDPGFWVTYWESHTTSLVHINSVTLGTRFLSYGSGRGRFESTNLDPGEWDLHSLRR